MHSKLVRVATKAAPIKANPIPGAAPHALIPGLEVISRDALCREISHHDGRVMKLSVSGDELDTFLYDRDNGQGSAEAVVDACRASQGSAEVVV